MDHQRYEVINIWVALCDMYICFFPEICPFYTTILTCYFKYISSFNFILFLIANKQMTESIEKAKCAWKPEEIGTLIGQFPLFAQWVTNGATRSLF